MIALALLYRASRAAGSALVNTCLFILFLFALLLAAVWRWS